MKLPTLLGLFLVALMMPTVATTAQSQQGSPRVETAKPFELHPLVSTTWLSSEAAPQKNSYQFSGERSKENEVCYKIRSYHVVREGRNSDVVRPDGYSTCEPASKYQTKRTVLVRP